MTRSPSVVRSRLPVVLIFTVPYMVPIETASLAMHCVFMVPFSTIISVSPEALPMPTVQIPLPVARISPLSILIERFAPFSPPPMHTILSPDESTVMIPVVSIVMSP